MHAVNTLVNSYALSSLPWSDLASQILRFKTVSKALLGEVQVDIIASQPRTIVFLLYGLARGDYSQSHRRRRMYGTCSSRFMDLLSLYYIRKQWSTVTVRHLFTFSSIIYLAGFTVNRLGAGENA